MGFPLDVYCNIFFLVIVVDNNKVVLCSSSNGLGNIGEIPLFVKDIIIPSELDAPKAERH